MDVAGVARLGRRDLGHEAHRFAVLSGDFFDPLLEDHVPVGHFHGLAVGEIDFVLAPAPLALAAFDGHAGGGQTIADGAHQRLITTWLHEVIIDAIIARRLEVAISGFEGGSVGLLVEVELELARAEAGEATFLEAVQLASQHRARGFGHRSAARMSEIAQDQH